MNNLFYVLLAVSKGVISEVELFDNADVAQAAHDKLQRDYDSEADDLQLITIPLSEAISNTSNQTPQIHLTRIIDDVKEIAHQKRVSLTDDECTIILESIEDNYDPSIGVNWDILAIAIDSFFDNQLYR